MTAANADLARSETEGIIRKALDDLVFMVEHMQNGWAIADPATQGDRWTSVKKAAAQARRALDATPDPKPGQCTRTWLDPLDNLWDRCGLPLRHEGDHKPEYMMRARPMGEVADHAD